MLAVIRKYAFWPIVLIVMAVLFVVLKFVAPLQLITTGSMEPSIMPWSLALDVRVSHVEVGQVITFVDEQGGNVTHRVIGFGPDGGILTKGDANQAPDLHTTPLTMKGVVGAPLGGIGIPLWMLIAVILSLILGYMGISLLRESKEEEEDTSDAPSELAHT